MIQANKRRSTPRVLEVLMLNVCVLKHQNKLLWIFVHNTELSCWRAEAEVILLPILPQNDAVSQSYKSLTTRYNLKRQDWKKTTSLEEMPPVVKVSCIKVSLILSSIKMTFDNLSCSRNLVNQTSGSTCCQVCCLNTDICGIHTNIRISAQNSQKSFLRPQNAEQKTIIRQVTM